MIPSQEPAPRRIPTVFILAAAVIVIAGMRYAQPLLVPLMLAALIVAISSPITAWVSHRGLPAIVGAVIALVVDMALIACVGLLLTFAASELQEKVPAYTARLSMVAASLAAALKARKIPVSEEAISSALGADTVFPVLGRVLSELANAASSLMVVMLVVFFALCEVGGLGDRLKEVVRERHEGFAHMDRVIREVQKYLLVKTVTSLILAGLAFGLLKIVGVSMALLLASLMFLLHFVPNVGAVIATVPAVAAALLDRGPGAAFAVLLGYVLIILVVGSVFESRALGRTLGVSPLVVLIGLIFWGWLWGAAGALLSVPLTMIAKIVLENDERLSWLARMTEPAGGPAPIAQRIKRTFTLRPRPSIGIGSVRPSRVPQDLGTVSPVSTANPAGPVE